MRKRWFKVVVIVALILLPVPVGIWWIYWEITKLPEEITIATGPEDGLYRPLIESLADEIWVKLKVKVRLVDTEGSLENLELLQEGAPPGKLDREGKSFEGKVDFALYQPGTLEVSGKHGPDFAANVEFVANLYSQPAHFIVRREAKINSPAQLVGMRVHVGLKNSGDYAMSLALLDFFNLEEDIVAVSDLEYQEIVQEFEDGTLDAAFITLGVDAPVFVDLAKTGKCDLIEIPNGQALAKRHLFTY